MPGRKSTGLFTQFWSDIISGNEKKQFSRIRVMGRDIVLANTTFLHMEKNIVTTAVVMLSDMQAVVCRCLSVIGGSRGWIIWIG